MSEMIDRLKMEVFPGCKKVMVPAWDLRKLLAVVHAAQAQKDKSLELLAALDRLDDGE